LNILTDTENLKEKLIDDALAFRPSHFRAYELNVIIVVIVHLLGLAPEAYLAAPDNGPWAGYRGGAVQPSFPHCSIEPAVLVLGNRTRSRPRFGTNPLTLDQLNVIIAFQLFLN
jgi:hypothetical protein